MALNNWTGIKVARKPCTQTRTATNSHADPDDRDLHAAQSVEKSGSRRCPSDRLQWRQLKRSYALCLPVAALNPAVGAVDLAPVRVWCGARAAIPARVANADTRARRADGRSSIEAALAQPELPRRERG